MLKQTLSFLLVASPRVKADLAWAVSASTEYVASAEAAPKAGKGKKGKKKSVNK